MHGMGPPFVMGWVSMRRGPPVTVRWGEGVADIETAPRVGTVVRRAGATPASPGEPRTLGRSVSMSVAHYPFRLSTSGGPGKGFSTGPPGPGGIGLGPQQVGMPLAASPAECWTTRRRPRGTGPPGAGRRVLPQGRGRARRSKVRAHCSVAVAHAPVLLDQGGGGGVQAGHVR